MPLKAVHNYQTRHAADAALLTNLAAIDKGFASLRDNEAKHIKASKELTWQPREKDVCSCRTQKDRVNHEKFRNEFAKGQRALKQLAEEISAILKGREINHGAMKRCPERTRHLLIQTGETIERLDKTNPIAR